MTTTTNKKDIYTKALNLKFDMSYISDRITLLHYATDTSLKKMYQKDVRNALKQLRDDITFWLEDDFVASIGTENNNE